MMRAPLPIVTYFALCLGGSAWAQAVVEGHFALGKPHTAPVVKKR